MKLKLMIAAFVFMLVSCAGDKLEIAKAKETAEGCLNAIAKEDYTRVRSEYYSDELGDAQPAEELEAKFKKLKEVTGAMTSFELTESVNSDQPGEESKVILTYMVKHDRVTTTEKFVIVIEGGKYKIVLHDIKN